jgi:hypothetical protein
MANKQTLYRLQILVFWLFFKDNRLEEKETNFYIDFDKWLIFFQANIRKVVGPIVPLVTMPIQILWIKLLIAYKFKHFFKDNYLEE